MQEKCYTWSLWRNTSSDVPHEVRKGSGRWRGKFESAEVNGGRRLRSKLCTILPLYIYSLQSYWTKGLVFHFFISTIYKTELQNYLFLSFCCGGLGIYMSSLPNLVYVLISMKLWFKLILAVDSYSVIYSFVKLTVNLHAFDMTLSTKTLKLSWFCHMMCHALHDLPSLRGKISTLLKLVSNESKSWPPELSSFLTHFNKAFT